MRARAAGLIAAAGSSARMGTCKALLPFSRQSVFVERLARVFLTAGLDPVIVTVPAGEEGLAIEQALSLLPVLCAENQHPTEGLAGSVMTALRHADDAEALVMTPVDCPFADATLVQGLLGMVRGSAAAAAPEVNGKRGHPVVFARAAFELLCCCAERGGPRAVLEALGDDVVALPWSDPYVLEDVDTPDDYLRLFGVKLPRAPRPPGATRRRG